MGEPECANAFPVTAFEGHQYYGAMIGRSISFAS